MVSYNFLLCRYHRCDSLLWLEVREWLQQCMVQRVQQGHDAPCVFLSSSMWNSLQDFIEQMEIGYIHPRRDSYHVSFLNEKYHGNALPDRAKKHLPFLSMKKNQKSGRKEVCL